jgi:hypothetical protein
MVLKDNEEPKVIKSKTESEDPRRAMPKRDTCEPNRAILRKARDAPKCTQSITDKEEPNLE